VKSGNAHALLIGYSSLSEPMIQEGIARLAKALLPMLAKLPSNKSN
jgi:DNA-binding transcriptional MocR family regulator